MKSNKEKNVGIINNFKYFMLIPITLLVVSLIFGFVFGLNYDYDFRNVSTFDVKFNTTVSESEYKELNKQVKNLIDTKFNDYRIERIGDGAQNGLLVKIANDKGQYDSDIENLKSTIESSLIVNCGTNITSPVTITTSETNNILPKNASELIGYSVLALACIMLFVFIYYAIRYNFVASVTFVLTILFEIAMLTTVMIVARVPFNYYFVVAYFVMTLMTLLISTYINNYIRSTLNLEKYNKYSNSDRVYDAYKKTFRPVIIFTSLITLSLFAVMFFGDLSLIFTVISIILGILIALFGIYMFEYCLWSFWYKKEKDATLKRKIELEKKRANESANSSDKIVV